MISLWKRLRPLSGRVDSPRAFAWRMDIPGLFMEIQSFGRSLSPHLKSQTARFQDGPHLSSLGASSPGAQKARFSK